MAFTSSCPVKSPDQRLEPAADATSFKPVPIVVLPVRSTIAAASSRRNLPCFASVVAKSTRHAKVGISDKLTAPYTPTLMR